MDAETIKGLKDLAEPVARRGGDWTPVPMGVRVSKDGLIIEALGAEIHPDATPYAEVIRIGVVGKPRTAQEVWEDARYIAAANPQAILSLIAEVERLQGLLTATTPPAGGQDQEDA